MTSPVSGLRRELTLWYVGVFALILLGFGIAAVEIVAWQLSASLDRALAQTVDAVALLVREGRADAGEVAGLLTPGRRVWTLWADSDPDQLTGEVWVAEALARALAEGEVRVRHETADDQTWRLVARAETLPDGGRVAIAAAADVVEIEEQYPGLLLGFLFAGIAALSLVAIGGWRLARRSLEPMERAFSEMRRFMADAAHELRTPLAVVRAHADVALQQARSPSEYMTALTDVSREAARLGDIVERLLLLARADAGDWPVVEEEFYLDDVLLDVAHGAGALGAARGVRVVVGDVAEARVRGDPDLLRQLLMAIVDNGVKHSPDGATVELMLEVGAGRCLVQVRDRGQGIPEEIRERVFERFFRGDAARGREGGAGLGLAIARWIAGLHGGTLSLRSNEGGGTCAVLELPSTPGSSG